MKPLVSDDLWKRVEPLHLAELNGEDQIDWSRALIDASFCKAPEGGENMGPNPTDRRKSGSKHHILTDFGLVARAELKPSAGNSGSPALFLRPRR